MTYYELRKAAVYDKQMKRTLVAEFHFIYFILYVLWARVHWKILSWQIYNTTSKETQSSNMLSAILKTQHVLLPDCKREGMSEMYNNFITYRVEYLHVKSLYQLCDQYSSQSLMNENPNLWYHLLFIPTMGSVILSTNLLSIINRYMSCICITFVGMKKHEFNFINVWVKIVYRIPIFNLYNSRLIIYWYRGWEQKVLSRQRHRFWHMWAVCVFVLGDPSSDTFTHERYKTILSCRTRFQSLMTTFMRKLMLA